MHIESPSIDSSQQMAKALGDLAQGLAKWRLAWRMAVLEIRKRYKRTKLGPFWATLSMIIFVFSLGFVFSLLWKLEISTYLPFLTSGFIAWMPLSTIVMESATTFTSNEALFRQSAFPYTVFNLSTVFRNLIVFAHHMVAYVAVVLIFDVELSATIFLALLGLFFFAINGLWVSLLTSIVCARYRDIQPLLTNVLQIILWVTPIFWSPEQIGDRGFLLVDWNVFYHFVDLVRAPLLGQVPSLLSYGVAIGVTVIGWALTIKIFARYRRYIIYWL